MPNCLRASTGVSNAPPRWVLQGGVFVEDDGATTQVRCTNGFYAVNGHCPCPDHARAQDGYCKHRLAKALYRRASEMHREPQPQPRAVLADTPAQLGPACAFEQRITVLV